MCGLIQFNETMRPLQKKVGGACVLVIFVYILWKLRSRAGIRNDSLDTVVASVRMVGPMVADNSEKHSKIPHIIHQTWKTKEIPFLFERWVVTWLDKNPDWEYWFWTDEDIRNLVSQKYPKFLSLFDSYPMGGYRADAFRYFVMYEHGGVYADMDVECLKSLNPLTQQHACIITQEPWEHAHFISFMGIPLVSNAIMACRPRHQFFEHVISDLPGYAGWLIWNDILHATGPYMVTEVYKGYVKGSHWLGSSQSEDVLHLGSAEEFQPSVDASMLDKMREMCLHSEGHSFLSNKYVEMQEKLCKKITGFGFSNEPTGNSYTNHHWTHIWAGKLYDPWGVFNSDKTFNIEDIPKAIKQGK